jgi:hypothetical protein
MRKTISFLLVLVVLLGSGCAGFGSGYAEKAQVMTSEQYSEAQYKAFINDYNSIRMAGANIMSAQSDREMYLEQHGNPEFYTSTQEDNYQELLFYENSYILQYNGFVTNYNNRMRDITTNQMWMKPQNYPDSIDLYVKGRLVVNSNDNPELVIPNQMPRAPDGWVPPER